jgi:acyl dehydratase
VGIDTSQLGSVRRAEQFRVGSTRLGQYAAALNDENQAHLEGRWATPVFANVPPMQPAIEALRLVTSDAWAHAAHDFHFHRMIRPGMRLFAEAEAVGIQPGRGGVNIVVRSRTRTGEDELVDEQYLTAFVRGGAIAGPVGSPGPEASTADGAAHGSPDAEAKYPLDGDQTHRYADAARDYAEYRLRPDAARALGFDDVVVHEQLLLGIASRTVISEACGHDSGRLKRLACRFERPLCLQPGQTLTTQLWKVGRRGERAAFAFLAVNRGGDVVGRGLAEVVP